jgi:hypothetical protein
MTKFDQNLLTKRIQSYFAQFKTFVGQPKYTLNRGKVIVQIPYFQADRDIPNSEEKLKTLGGALSLLSLGNAVEIRLVQLRYPYLDSCILGQYLAFNAGKYNFLRMKKRIFKKAKTTNKTDYSNMLPYSLMGVKMELAGRLTTQRSIPRKTVLNAHKGSFNVSNEESLNLSHYTSKNKVGAYTMKV